VLVVTGRGKRAIEDHFDRNFELEHYLEQSGRDGLLAEMREINELADFHYIRQRDPLGLGHAVSVASEHVGQESFAVLLGDDIMVDDATLLRRMLDVHARHGGSVLALLEVPIAEISAYGSVAVEPVAEGLMRVQQIIEKPKPEEALSNLAVIGRYVFTPGIFGALAETQPGIGGEIQLTDAIGGLLDREPVYGVVFSEGRYDIGRKFDFLRANIELGLERADLREQLEQLMVDLVHKRGLE